MPNTGDIVRASDFEAIKPQLSIGSVTTGAAGSNASASITGTSPNFKLNLTIPRGNTGATGATGPRGPSGVYTGPLKPTSSYWRDANEANDRAYAPQGGTWACFAASAPLYNTGQNYVNTRANIFAGGALLTNIPSGSQILSVLCWRIQ